ncbi:MAG: class I SAM-dependent methyltransferase [Anaerolineae bacterium]|nr:class I SAM-dependent methyltransferase [Phycisphaerae bacterium]
MNDYSSDWIDTFLTTIDPAQTQREVALLQRQLPRDRFGRVVDICCGLGRHSGALAALGYSTTGIDRDATLIAKARRANPHVQFVTMDARGIETLDQQFDAAICMWQSFGYLERAGNDRLLSGISKTLRPGGCFVLDIYNRKFFEPRQGVLTSNRNGRAIQETKAIDGERIRIELIYDGDSMKSDRFDWEIFTVDQIASRANAVSLKMIAACSAFDERAAVSDSVPRMQVVFEKTG